MSETCRLPFAHTPVLSVPYFIVKPNLGERFPEILSQKYLNCRFTPASPGAKLTICLEAPWFWERGLMASQTMTFYRDAIRDAEFDLPGLIKNFITAGFYPAGNLPLHRIDDGIADQRNFCWTAVGYDDGEGTLTVCGIDDEKRRLEYALPCARFAEALLQPDTPLLILAFWKCNPAVEGLYDPAAIVRKLSDYIHSRGPAAAGALYGLSAMEALADDFADRGERGEPLPTADVQGFFEHKYIMRERMQFFAEKGIARPEWVRAAEEILDTAERIRDIGRVYNETRDGCLTRQMARLIRSTADREKEYLIPVLNSLM